MDQGTAETIGGARLLTLEQWAALDEDEPGELVDGVLEDEEMPTFAHELVVIWLATLFQTWIGARGGFVGGSEAKLAVKPRRGRKPDLFVYLPGRKRPSLRAPIAHVPPSIVVEVLTPTPRDARRDRVDKVDDYAAFGVDFYWLMDPELRTLEIWQLGADGRYVRALGVSDGRIDLVPGCEGLVVDLDALWQELDAFEGETEPHQR
jgi:Uma2 family endonuclease